MSKSARILMIILGVVAATMIILYMGNANHEAHENKKAVIEHAKDDSDVVRHETVIQKVYIHEEKFDKYDPFNNDYTTETSSYWYVQFDTEKVRGYDVLEIDVPYPDIIKMIKKLKAELNYNGYVQISFFKRVPFESYKSYKEGEDEI